MADVITLHGDTFQNRQNKQRDIEPSVVAQGIVEHADELEMLFAVGIDKHGRLYATSSSFDLGDQILLLERIKRKLLDTFGEDRFR